MVSHRAWRWSLRVEPTVLPIASVRYRLHDTFAPARVQCAGSDTRITRTGWGHFDVPVRVQFVDGSVVRAVYPMTFDHATHCVDVALSMRRVDDVDDGDDVDDVDGAADAMREDE